MLDTEGRKIVFTALTGSHNYNLNHEEVKISKGEEEVIIPASDKDIKVFVSPDFVDLYYGKHFKSQIISETVDYEGHDIRKFPDMIMKSNLAYLEILESNGFEVNEGTQDIYNYIIVYGNKLAVCNLPKLFESCIEIHKEKMRTLLKGTAGTQHLVKAFGYDTKQALHAYRGLDLLERFYERDFVNLRGALKYSVAQSKRMLEIKFGRYTEEEFRTLVAEKYNKVIQLEDKYTSHPMDVKIIDEFRLVVRETIKQNLL